MDRNVQFVAIRVFQVQELACNATGLQGDEGGGIGSWDARATRHALTSVMRRREEAYHDTLREADSGDISAGERAFRDAVTARVARLLGAFRDKPPADIDSLVRVLLRISEMVCALPGLVELDLNPLIVDAVLGRFAELSGDLYRDPREEDAYVGLSLWSGASFQDMIKRHMMTIAKYPHAKLGKGKPYEGIENLRPESKETVETFMSWQPPNK